MISAYQGTAGQVPGVHKQLLDLTTHSLCRGIPCVTSSMHFLLLMLLPTLPRSCSAAWVWSARKHGGLGWLSSFCSSVQSQLSPWMIGGLLLLLMLLPDLVHLILLPHSSMPSVATKLGPDMQVVRQSKVLSQDLCVYAPASDLTQLACRRCLFPQTCMRLLQQSGMSRHTLELACQMTLWMLIGLPACCENTAPLAPGEARTMLQCRHNELLRLLPCTRLQGCDWHTHMDLQCPTSCCPSTRCADGGLSFAHLLAFRQRDLACMQHAHDAAAASWQRL